MESLTNSKVIPGKPWVTLLATASAIWACYIFGLVIYRLYFSPIANFPGPKLAALTKWYECYWEIARNGRFTFHIQDLHKKYGVLCRICGCSGVEVDAKQDLSSASHPMSSTSWIPTTSSNCTPIQAA